MSDPIVSLDQFRRSTPPKTGDASNSRQSKAYSPRERLDKSGLPQNDLAPSHAALSPERHVRKPSQPRKAKAPSRQAAFLEEGAWTAESTSNESLALLEHTRITPVCEAMPPASLVDDPTLPRAALDFRQLFVSAVETLVAEAMAELESSASPKDVTIKINISTVLKRAPPSPLTTHSPRHRDVLLPLVDRESLKIKKAQSNRCTLKTQPTVASLQKELRNVKKDTNKPSRALHRKK